MSVFEGLADGWVRLPVGKQDMFINNTEKIATRTAPSASKPRRNSRLPTLKDDGMFLLHPQPDDLPEGWFQCVALSQDGQGGILVFSKLDEDLIQFADPRPKWQIDGGPLPEGWTASADEEGDMVYTDHNSGTKTYCDPRLTVEGEDDVVSHKRDSVALPDVLRPRTGSLVVGADTWQFSAVDHPAFNALSQNLCSMSSLPQAVANKTFNRYMNILPDPKTRVLLPKIKGSETTEYINANFVPASNGKPREFIAAMGPLDTTIPAFWRMIWENKTTSIVMATALIENGTVKCARYWPKVRYNEARKLGAVKYGDVEVAVMYGERRPGFIRTYLRVSKGGEERKVSHFWYNEWPDHGVPESCRNVLTLLKEVHDHNRASKGGPSVIHCSAGIGRTGTLIAIDYAMQRLTHDKKVDFLEIVRELRVARGGMVQHPQQYEFVIRAAVEFANLKKKPYTVIVSKQTEILDSAVDKAVGQVPDSYVHPSQKKDGQPASASKGKQAESEEMQQLAELIAAGKPADMPEFEFKKLKRKYDKHNAKFRAKHSIRRRLSDAELHGELRLGTIGRERRKKRSSIDGVFGAK